MAPVIGTSSGRALGPGDVGRIARVSWLFVVLLALAVAVLVTAEWPRLAALLDRRARPVRKRARRKTHLHVVGSEQDEFAASVQRDLDRLPTIEEREHR